MSHPLRSISYLIFAFVLVLYGLPRLPLFADKTEAVIFSAVWIGFALLIIGANLYQVIGSKEERDMPPSLTVSERERARKRTQSDYE